MSRVACLIALTVVLGAQLFAAGRNKDDSCTKSESKKCEYPQGCFCEEPGDPDYIKLNLFYFNHSSQKCAPYVGADDICNSFETQEKCEHECEHYFTRK
uniref:Putative secreted protein n=1 Tax=Amblyomma americanum TaxID=6943 RepID=A0A0C9SEK6_AMBAM